MRSLDSAESELAAASGAGVNALVVLYKALGGGWESGQGPYPAE